MDEKNFSGCLIGQCLGDALGFPVEGQPAEVCRDYMNYIGTVGRGDFPFGQYTDDSQLARELLLGFEACGRFDPEHYAHRIARLFAGNRVVGGGRATKAAAERMHRGVPWDKAGALTPTASNGSAMRAGVIGLLFDDPQDLIQAACDQSRCTHQDPRCLAGSIAIAGAVMLACRRDTIIPGRFLDHLASWMDVHPGFQSHVRQLVAVVGLPPEEAVSLIAVKDSPYAYAGRISPFVVPSVLWSLYSFLRSPYSYWETICTAIRCGGDVDTTAAMAGAISGAYLGLDALPNLAFQVTDRGIWGYHDLVGLAHRCYDIVKAEVA